MSALFKKPSPVSYLQKYHDTLCPPKFCINIAFTFSWDHCKSQEKRNNANTNKEYYGIFESGLILQFLLGLTRVPILGDPGADRGGNGKSKRAKENGDEEKYSSARRAHGDKFLSDKFQTAEVILNSDWCQKCFVFFCPIRGQQAVKSFRVFLH